MKEVEVSDKISVYAVEVPPQYLILPQTFNAGHLDREEVAKLCCLPRNVKSQSCECQAGQARKEASSEVTSDKTTAP